LSGRQLLHFEVFARLVDIQWLDTSFGLGGRAAFIGFPTEDGSAGSSFYLPYGTRELAMSSACREKEAAWEFLRQILLPRYTDLSDNMLYERHVSALSINREDSDAMNLYRRVQRGDVDQCSIGFCIGAEDVEFRDDGSAHWTIREVYPLCEVTVATFPAYEATSVSARAADTQRARERQAQTWRESMVNRLKRSGT